ncbi:valine--tRNA ligase [Solwaraspora sp. WMMA2080]|uniref:valine--tRNA ligase n=1 Tax=unclassified Solwaraspora TaxID=2627926 RepID=UPI00248C30EC|nr:MULTISPECIES: valine--tRNA ligase [unclassified Solwaraspora]WBB95443.1 valine--tRNA ligase [Solwaraspora sp. WMMA2059]WBC20652.1 valine--tRNA ligase [Solwaraspora sp. WMMA2080]
MLPAQYAPGEVEHRRYERWVAEGYFRADAGSGKPPFTIVVPPPNVTGSLHVGHALDHSIQDTLIRRKRMQGFEALWLPGMDHAGIATQNVVERQLAAEGLSRHDLGREQFIDRVWQWKAESGGTILGQMRRLGDSVDWDRERFTMDEGLSRAVQTIFKRLYDGELIYRAERIINWCPRCRTALSDIEVEHSDDDGELVSIRYGEGDASIVVATTRVETMLGDTAVAVHPDDDRYRHLVGTEVELPLTGRRIPIVADAHVDPTFGTGAVKVTPAHDPNDFEIGQRHGLPSLTILDERAVVTAAGPFEGLDRFEARPAIVAALRAEGRVVAEKRPYVHAVGHCSRCRTTVEPRLSLQWFVRTGPLAKAAGDAVRDGRTRVEPPELAARYFAWVDNMHDWCISRQLWWGHRIPVWYGPAGEVVCVGPDEQPPAGAGWRQDEDVLDTWFSSALWPFSTLGWPDQTDDLRTFYPTSVLVTGYDILFFWVARMMMFGLYAMEGRQPFDVVALHGMVRDQFGKKMSKSYGNVVDPLDWIDRFGADATRFTLVRGANPGADVPISEEWCQGSRNFCNKLWNATRFALLNGAHLTGDLPDPADLGMTDRWIMSRLQEVTAQVDQQFEAFELAKACDTLYHFAWDDVCDWYLELSKPVLGAGGEAADRTRRVLGHVLDQLLRLLHPVTPFVTDELWSALAGSGQPVAGSLMVASWPVADPAWHDPAAEAELAVVQRVVTEVRRFRSDQGLRPTQRVSARLTGLADAGVGGHEPLIRSLTRLDEPAVEFSATAKLAVTAQVGVEFDTRGSIDVAAERARLTKDRSAAKREAEQCRAKLGNSAFVDKAPAPVVDKIRTRLTAAEAELARIAGALAALPAADGEQS